MNLRNAKNNHLHRRAKIAVKELSEREVNWFLFFFNDPNSPISAFIDIELPYPIFKYQSYSIREGGLAKKLKLEKSFTWFLESKGNDVFENIYYKKELLIPERDLAWLKNNLKAIYYTISKLNLCSYFKENPFFPTTLDELYDHIVFLIDSQVKLINLIRGFTVRYNQQPISILENNSIEIQSKLMSIKTEYFIIQRDDYLEWLNKKDDLQVKWALNYIKNSNQDLLSLLEGKPLKHPKRKSRSIKDSSNLNNKDVVVKNESPIADLNKEKVVKKESPIADFNFASYAYYKDMLDAILNKECFILLDKTEHRFDLIEFYVEFILSLDFLEHVQQQQTSFKNKQLQYLKSFKDAWYSKSHRDKNKTKLQNLELPKRTFNQLTKLSEMYGCSEKNMLIELIENEYKELKKK